MFLALSRNAPNVGSIREHAKGATGGQMVVIDNQPSLRDVNISLKRLFKFYHFLLTNVDLQNLRLVTVTLKT